jgi:pyrroline-5-carboxylate reductase
MARALARGVVDSGLLPGSSVVAHDPQSETALLFNRQVAGSRLQESNVRVVEDADIVVLAVKPQNFTVVADELHAAELSDKLFVSVLAGVTLGQICARLDYQRVVRVMPNTPCLIQCGAAAYALGPGATEADGEWVEKMLASVGLAFRVPEELLDAVTGLSGSGPAYIYTVIEALSDGGVRVGLPRSTASALAAQTVLGAARMVLDSDDHPATLRERVTSPGGTTIAGLQMLERCGLRSALIDAVEAATQRSVELGKLSRETQP